MNSHMNVVGVDDRLTSAFSLLQTVYCVCGWVCVCEPQMFCRRHELKQSQGL